MQTLAETLQSHELPTSVSCRSSTSPALSDTSTYASTSSAHSTYQGHPKIAPAKDPPSQLDGKRSEHILVKFPPMKSDSTPTRRYRASTKNKTIVKPGGTAENVVYHCTLEDVTTDITPRNHTRVLSKGMFLVSDSFTINIEIIVFLFQ
jgi:hypothetical protein